MFMLPDVTLRSLEAVLTLDRERHFGRAATALGITQPSLSQLVRRVEDVLGASLFERRPVRRTPAGREFLDRVAVSMGTLEEAVSVARAVSEGRRGTLHLGFTASVVFSPMPAIVAAYRRAHPGVDVLLSESWTSDQLERVAAGQLDAGFVRQHRRRSDLQRIRIQREPFLAAVPRAHPVAREEAVAVSALADEPFVHFPKADAPELHEDLQQMCASAGFEPRVVQTASEWITIVALVETGVGVSLVPRSMTRVAWPGVRFLEITPAGRPADVFAIFPVRLSAPAARFREVVRATLRTMDVDSNDEGG